MGMHSRVALWYTCCRSGNTAPTTTQEETNVETKDQQNALQDRLHSNDGVWEAVQCALEEHCEKLGLDSEDYEWSLRVEKTSESATT